MPRRRYTIRPSGLLGVTSAYSGLVQPSVSGIISTAHDTTYNCRNFRTTQKAIKKRWGYATDTTVFSSDNSNKWVADVYGYRQEDGTYRSVFYIEGNSGGGETSDLAMIDLGDGTYQYITQAYTTGKVTNVTTAANSVVTGSGTTWSTNVAAGDYFIVNIAADYDADAEPQTNWMKIQSVDTDTQLTLTGSYAGTTGVQNNNYIVRKVYTGHAPSSITHAKFVALSNVLYVAIPNNPVQKLATTDTYASDLDTTYANDAKYIIDYADRLILANVDDASGNPGPCTVRWSKNGDPTNFTDETAGSADLLETTDPITGLGKIGPNLIIYKTDSITFASRTGQSTAPILFGSEIRGIGCPAPHSIVDANGTNYFVGRHNFYKIEGETPVPIGDDVKDFFFYYVNSDLYLSRVFGFHNRAGHEILWVPIAAGNSVYSYDYLEKVWNKYETRDPMRGGGQMYRYISATQTELEPFFTDETKIYFYSADYSSDDGDNMVCSWRTCQTDFSDQDPEALDRWKTVYEVKVTYLDLTANVSLQALIQTDTGSTTSIGSNTIGSASACVRSTSYYGIYTGDVFQIYLSNTSSSKLHISAIDIFYELGGKKFNI